MGAVAAKNTSFNNTRFRDNHHHGGGGNKRLLDDRAKERVKMWEISGYKNWKGDNDDDNNPVGSTIKSVWEPSPERQLPIKKSQNHSDSSSSSSSGSSSSDSDSSSSSSSSEEDRK